VVLEVGVLEDDVLEAELLFDDVLGDGVLELEDEELVDVLPEDEVLADDESGVKSRRLEGVKPAGVELELEDTAVITLIQALFWTARFGGGITG